MCTYNGALYVRKQLESIINQFLNVDEIIVCDDGSTDDTLTVVYDVAHLYTKIKWCIEQNSHSLGVKKNFEKAIKESINNINDVEKFSVDLFSVLEATGAETLMELQFAKIKNDLEY